MNKKNIAFFSGDITRSGGTERVAILIAEELNKDSNYNVSFISLTERKESPFFHISENINRYTLSQKEIKGVRTLLTYTKSLKKIVKQRNIDLLIDIDGIIDMYSVPIKKSTGVKIISWEHFNLYHHPSPRLRKMVRKYAVPRVDAIVTLTEEDKGYYQKDFNIKCPIECIYNPVIWDKTKYDYNEESKVLLSAGRLTYQKGFDLALEVAKNVMPHNPNWKWIILGEGEDRKLLEDKIEEYGLEYQVILPGNMDNMSDYYKDASMFIMTSRYEGLPMTLLETKPYRLPIVSFKCKTGPSELVRDGVNGYLLEENDIEGMVGRINELISNKDKRIEFSKQTILDTGKFELDLIVDKWRSLINELLDK